MKLKKLLGLALSGVLTISAIGCSKTQPEKILMKKEITKLL